MSRSALSVLVFTLFVPASRRDAPPAETLLLRSPTVSATNVAFVYAGDLWVASRAGGEARRLTVHPGRETNPHFSPDGQWIAFTGEYDGNADVYDYPPLMDGGFVTAPRIALFSPSGEWDAENVGVPPDIEVEMIPKLVIGGHDPQLEKAVVVVLEELQRTPPPARSVPHPPYPTRARPQ